MKEIHLFIIWEKAQNKRFKILDDIQQKFNIKYLQNIQWSPDKFSENLSRFYGFKLPKGSNKEKHCGNGAFTLVVVEDTNPIYQDRETSSGKENVNINIFDKKSLYRQWTGGGHKIHATNNIEETRHDLVLLIGKTIEEVSNMDTIIDYKDKHIDIEYRDLEGSHGWINFEQLIKVLNQTCNYVFIRNFEKFPQDYYEENHNDIDMLVENKEKIRIIINSKPSTKYKYRVRETVQINEKEIFFDLRYVGDSYYCRQWEEEILNTRVLSDKGFYIPNKINYFYSLLYHALIHKKEISVDYLERFKYLNHAGNFGIRSYDRRELLKVLDEFITSQEYYYSEPSDLSVMYNLESISSKDISLKRRVYNRYHGLRKVIKECLKNEN